MATATSKDKKAPAKNKKTPAVVIGLAEIVAATLDEKRGFIYTSPAVHEPLIKSGDVEINTELTNADGEIATRATEKGKQQMQNTNTETKAVAAAVVGGFKIETDIAIPAVAGRGRSGACKYPFDALEKGQSFFVADSEGKEAAKSLASTVSSANARYAEVIDGETRTNRKGNVVPVTKQTRHFIMRSVEENGVKGARIWRDL